MYFFILECDQRETKRPDRFANDYANPVPGWAVRYTAFPKPARGGEILHAYPRFQAGNLHLKTGNFEISKNDLDLSKINFS